MRTFVLTLAMIGFLPFAAAVADEDNLLEETGETVGEAVDATGDAAGHVVEETGEGARNLGNEAEAELDDEDEVEVEG